MVLGVICEVDLSLVLRLDRAYHLRGSHPVTLVRHERLSVALESVVGPGASDGLHILILLDLLLDLGRIHLALVYVRQQPRPHCNMVSIEHHGHGLLHELGLVVLLGLALGLLVVGVEVLGVVHGGGVELFGLDVHVLVAGEVVLAHQVSLHYVLLLVGVVVDNHGLPAVERVVGLLVLERAAIWSRSPYELVVEVVPGVVVLGIVVLDGDVLLAADVLLLAVVLELLLREGLAILVHAWVSSYVVSFSGPTGSSCPQDAVGVGLVVEGV